MRSSAAILAAVTTMAAVVCADEYFTGDGTAYTLGQTSAGNCNMMSALSFASHNYAAINNDQWDNLGNCGRCAEVSCADDRCADQSYSEVVQILDRCPECVKGDLDLSPTVFTALTGSDPARYTIKWKFVDCPVESNVNYCLKGGSNNYWTAVQPTNVATGVASLKVNGQETTMLDSAYYFLLDGASQTQTDLSSLSVTITDVNGNTIEDTVALEAGSCTEGASQFASSTPSSSTTQQSDTTAPTTATPTTEAPTQAPTQAPTSTPTPTSAPATEAPTPEPTETPVPTTTESPATTVPASSSDASSDSEDQDEQYDDEQSMSTSSDSSMSSSRSKTKAPVATMATPSTGTSEQNQQQGDTVDDASQSTGSGSDDNTQSATTQSGEAGVSTSPMIIALSAVGAVALVALIAMVVVAKQKKIREQKERDLEAPATAMMAAASFDVSHSPARRQDFAIL